MKKLFRLQWVVIVVIVGLTACQGQTQVAQTEFPTDVITQEMVSTTESVELTEVEEAVTSTPSPTEVPSAIISVTTEKDIVDGDTANIDSLAASPGADGLISLREAVLAANGTPDAKRITFSADLMGKVIYLGQEQQYDDPRIYVTGDHISIDGDVDGDGVSDITLDGSALNYNYSSAFILSASQLTIANLQFEGFQIFAIAFACVDDYCADRTYEDIVIKNNRIFSDVGGGGVIFTPLKIVSYMADTTLFSNISISNIQILDNTIAVSNGENGGIFLMAAGAGGSDNHLADILIEGNTITSPGATITVNAADGSSYYFNIPGDELFSDRNVVERLTILNNQLDPVGIGGDSARPTGLVMVAANYGNSDNVIREVLVSGNEVSSNAEHFAVFYATNNEVLPPLPVTTRGATGNAIENLEIVGNISHADTSAVSLIACAGQDPAPNGATGRISQVWIHDNQILDYKWEGIDIFAGVGEDDNLIEDVVIEDNTFTALDITKGQAIFIYAGGCSGCTRLSNGNQIVDLVIQNNLVNGNDFIFMYGGMEEFASNNTISYFLGENTLNPPDSTIDIVDFIAKTNDGNQVIALEQAP